MWDWVKTHISVKQRTFVRIRAVRRRWESLGLLDLMVGWDAPTFTFGTSWVVIVFTSPPTWPNAFHDTSASSFSASTRATSCGR